ncbi:MAG: hypothetical protein ACI83P_001117 [Janthinobacterium sp.]
MTRQNCFFQYADADNVGHQRRSMDQGIHSHTDLPFLPACLDDVRECLLPKPALSKARPS